MTKKKVGKRQKPQERKRQSRSRRKSLAVIALILCLGLTSLVLAQWRTIHTSFSSLTPPPQPSPTPQLSKEYIYAGGKLIATEEPGGSSPLSAPSSLIATGASSPTGTPPPQVTLTWAASTGGTVNHYQVERCQSFGQNCYSFVADVPASTPTVTYTDSGVGMDAAYLYRVRAVDDSGLYTGYSNVDLATTVTFTDDPLNPNSTKTIIKATHLNELRRAVNAVRALAGLEQAQWTYPDPVSTPQDRRRKIYLEDVTELRTNLDEALTILGRQQSYPATPPLARYVPVSAAHFTQIRDRVK